MSSEYFSLLRIPVLSGRVFTEAESEAEGPVAVVSALAARRLWPSGGAVGQTITIQDGFRTVRLPAWRSARVIGVVGDVAGAFSGVNGPETCVYFPTNGRAARNPSLLVRIGGDPVAARRILDTALDKVAPSAADLILPMDDVMALQSYPFRVTWWVAAFLGGVALLMTVSGIYGVMAYVVGQRTQEIGIRVALGAARRDIVWMMLRQSGGLAAIGLAAGAGLGARRRAGVRARGDRTRPVRRGRVHRQHGRNPGRRAGGIVWAGPPCHGDRSRGHTQRGVGR